MGNLEKVQDALKTRIVLCTGPGYSGKELLLSTAQNDCRFFSFKKIFLSTVNPENIDIHLGDCQAPIRLIPLQTKTLNCVNCLISSIEDALKDKDVLDSDIILFKHETYFAKNLKLIQKAVGALVINGYDLVIQNLTYGSQDTFSNGVFFINVSAARDIFSNTSLLRYLPHRNPSCEGFLQENFFRKVKLIYKVLWRYETRDDRLGFFHFLTGRDFTEDKKRTDFKFLYSDIHLED